MPLPVPHMPRVLSLSQGHAASWSSWISEKCSGSWVDWHGISLLGPSLKMHKVICYLAYSFSSCNPSLPCLVVEKGCLSPALLWSVQACCSLKATSNHLVTPEQFVRNGEKHPALKTGGASWRGPSNSFFPTQPHCMALAIMVDDLSVIWGLRYRHIKKRCLDQSHAEISKHNYVDGTIEAAWPGLGFSNLST